MRQPKALTADLSQLASQSGPELRARWAEVLGQPAPRRISRAVLLRVISWHLQAQAHGGLNRAVLRQLAPSPGDPVNRSMRGQRPLAPGTRLLRDWQGETHTVEVTAEGYLWRGERFRSLSVIATRITGTRWSGPRFFGLRPAAPS